MPQQAATIESLAEAFEMVKAMQADGLEWGGLFVRAHRGVRLIRRGRAYYEEVRRILLDIHDITERHNLWIARGFLANILVFGRLFEIPAPLYFTATLFLLVYVLLNWTRMGPSAPASPLRAAHQARSGAAIPGPIADRSIPPRCRRQSRTDVPRTRCGCAAAAAPTAARHRSPAWRRRLPSTTDCVR